MPSQQWIADGNGNNWKDSNGNPITISVSKNPDPQVMAQINRIDINVMYQSGDLVAVAAIALGIGEEDIEEFALRAYSRMRAKPGMTIPERYAALIEPNTVAVRR
jgi:hypothetical protein